MNIFLGVVLIGSRSERDYTEQVRTLAEVTAAGAWGEKHYASHLKKLAATHPQLIAFTDSWKAAPGPSTARAPTCS